MVVAALPAYCGPASTTVIGRRERADLLWGTYLNAASANIFDFDDTHIPTILHPSAPVAPVILALAEAHPDGLALSGRDLLTAFVLGVEIECRIANAVSPEHYQRGWHITATCGVFGAAAASGKLLGLDGPRHRHALANASVQTGGLVEALGTMSKSLGVGNAARNGLWSALLAARGFEGPEMPLEGRLGFLSVASTTPDFSRLTSGLGERWELLANTYKPYPCGVVLNPVIDACLDLHRAGGFAPDAIAEIIISGHPLLRERTDRPGVTTGRQAQVSAQHAAPVALISGAAGLDAFSDASVADPQLIALGRKIVFHDDSTLPVEAASVELVLADGRRLGVHIKQARGSLGNPMTDHDLEEKLAALCAYRGASLDPAALADAVWTLDQTENPTRLLDALRAGS